MSTHVWTPDEGEGEKLWSRDELLHIANWSLDHGPTFVPGVDAEIKTMPPLISDRHTVSHPHLHADGTWRWTKAQLKAMATPEDEVTKCAASLAENYDRYQRFEFEYTLEANGDVLALTCRIFRKDRVHPAEVTKNLSDYPGVTLSVLRQVAFNECASEAFRAEYY